MALFHAKAPSKGVWKRTLFLISDEPTFKDLERYKRLVAAEKGAIPDCIIMDALSEFKFRHFL